MSSLSIHLPRSLKKMAGTRNNLFKAKEEKKRERLQHKAECLGKELEGIKEA